ncbi:MAG: carboxymuconolactone decarboxylase family protein [Anaerolineaceae bacterium]
MTRLPKTARADFPEQLYYVFDRLPLGGDGAPLNIFGAMGNNPGLLRSYLRLANPLWAQCGLDPERRELVILRTALLQKSVYEWHQHVRIGREAGLSDDRIVALHEWEASDLFTEFERAILGYVDALVASDHPAQPIHDALAKHLPVAGVVGVNLLVGAYIMTAKFLGAMEVEPETSFVGWHLNGDS